MRPPHRLVFALDYGYLRVQVECPRLPDDPCRIARDMTAAEHAAYKAYVKSTGDWGQMPDGRDVFEGKARPLPSEPRTDGDCFVEQMIGEWDTADWHRGHMPLSGAVPVEWSGGVESFEVRFAGVEAAAE